MTTAAAIQQTGPSQAVKRLSILGSTGSIGQSTLDVVRQHATSFAVDALVGNSNIAQLAADAREFGARLAVTPIRNAMANYLMHWPEPASLLPLVLTP